MPGAREEGRGWAEGVVFSGAQASVWEDDKALEMWWWWLNNSVNARKATECTLTND